MKMKIFLSFLIIANILLAYSLSLKNINENEINNFTERNLNNSAEILRKITQNSWRGMQGLLDGNEKLFTTLNVDVFNVLDTVDLKVIQIEILEGEKLLIESNKVIDYLINSFAEILREYGHDIKLRETEINDRIMQFKRELDFVNIKEFDSTNRNLIIANEINNIRCATNKFIEEIANLTPTSSGMKLKYHPIVMPKNNCVKIGDLFEAEITLGKFVTNSLDNYELIVNGKKYDFDGNMINHQEKPKKIGENKLNIVLKIENFLTKEVRGYEEEYFYNVSK